MHCSHRGHALQAWIAITARICKLFALYAIKADRILSSK